MIKDMPLMTESEQYEVRKYLAINHEDGICHIYGDDGELQCSNVLRHGRMIDFRREPMQNILNIIYATRMIENDPNTNITPADFERFLEAGLDPAKMEIEPPTIKLNMKKYYIKAEGAVNETN